MRPLHCNLGSFAIVLPNLAALASVFYANNCRRRGWRKGREESGSGAGEGGRQWNLTGVRVRSHICDHKMLTFVQRLYRIANIRAQVLNGTVLKRPALNNPIIIVFYDT